MRRRTFVVLGASILVGIAGHHELAFTEPGQDAARRFVTEIPLGYRDWKLVSVAREEGSLDDIRAILGNDLAIQTYRDGKLPFPDGAIIARLAWSHDSSPENDRVFGQRQSFVAGAPKNGVQFMVKDSKKYASTGGWGFAHFDDGKPAAAPVLETCFACHAAVPSRDCVFTRYALDPSKGLATPTVAKENAMPLTEAARRSGGKTTDEDAIRPFHATFPDKDLAELRRRIVAARWPSKELVDDRSQGVQLATMQELARYWSTDYDWRKAEARLNALPQFVTTIDGVDIHFIHVRSKQENALPLIMTHGWPGSVFEMLETVGPLTDPTAHGGTPEDAFHLVLPSLPGYGLSSEPRVLGWDSARIAQAWAKLMARLGYTRYVAQGGDVGALVTDVMGRQAPKGLAGIHLSLLAGAPFIVDKLPKATEQERAAHAALATFMTDGFGYFQEQVTRPQTIGFSLLDSPMGLAAWMLDHDTDSYQKISRAFVGGQPTGNLTRDHLLDNITLYWLTGTGASAARWYWETGRAGARAHAAGKPPPPVAVPVAFTSFPGEIFPAPRSWIETAYPGVAYYNAVDRGGHFAAWEEPALFTSELRKAFKALRASSAK